MQVLHNFDVWYFFHFIWSPDFNVIEHLWWKFKELIHKIVFEFRMIKRNKLTRKKVLKAIIKIAFNQFTVNFEWDLPVILAHFMPKWFAVVKLVKKNKLNTSILLYLRAFKCIFLLFFIWFIECAMASRRWWVKNTIKFRLTTYGRWL